MLAAQLGVKVILELLEGRVRAAGDGDSGGLVLGGVRLDVMFERVVVDFIWTKTVSISPVIDSQSGRTYGGSIVVPTPSRISRRISFRGRAPGWTVTAALAQAYTARRTQEKGV